ncbi:S-adenosyl-L-methionine-dependent methyltransferase [Dissophora ornata]|nr:S-adenosyl-L-methionine-dependent methyltransferase [Dissophora ornata]
MAALTSFARSDLLLLARASARRSCLGLHARAFSASPTLAALTPVLVTGCNRAGARAQDTQSGDTSTGAKPDEDPIARYCEQHSTPLAEKFATLHARSIAAYPDTANKTISSLQGKLLQMLMRITKPRLVLELGCFMGYSAMAMADGMPRGATLYTCEKDVKAARLARDLFVQQGYSSNGDVPQSVKIELLEGDAMSSLQKLASSKLQFDVVFLDADKGNYINYLNFILDSDLLASDGYILADNVLFRGMVLQSTDVSPELPSPPPSPQLSHKSSISHLDTKQERRKASLRKTADHMNAFNEHVKSDPRIDVAVLPIFDGLSVIMRNE